MSITESNEEPRVDLADYLVFPLFLVCFLCTLVFFDVAQRAALFVSRRAHEKTVILLNKTLCLTLKMIGVQLLVHRASELSTDRPYLVISNHQSLFDVPILHTIFAAHRPRFIAKKELARGIPSVSFNLRHGLNAVIDRSNPRQAVPELERFAALMSDHRFASVLFPEGTRARTGELKRFLYTGFAVMLRHAPEADLVPVAIDGSWKLAVRNRGPLPRRTVIRVIVATPVTRHAQEDPKELMNQVHQRVSTDLQALRDGTFEGEFWPLV